MRSRVSAEYSLVTTRTLCSSDISWIILLFPPFFPSSENLVDGFLPSWFFLNLSTCACFIGYMVMHTSRSQLLLHGGRVREPLYANLLSVSKKEKASANLTLGTHGFPVFSSCMSSKKLSIAWTHSLVQNKAVWEFTENITLETLWVMVPIGTTFVIWMEISMSYWVPPMVWSEGEKILNRSPFHMGEAFHSMKLRPLLTYWNLELILTLVPNYSYAIETPPMFEKILLY